MRGQGPGGERGAGFRMDELPVCGPGLEAVMEEVAMRQRFLAWQRPGEEDFTKFSDQISVHLVTLFSGASRSGRGGPWHAWLVIVAVALDPCCKPHLSHIKYSVAT